MWYGKLVLHPSILEGLSCCNRKIQHRTHTFGISIQRSKLMNVFYIIVRDYLLWYIISEWKSSAQYWICVFVCVCVCVCVWVSGLAMLGILLKEITKEEILNIEWLVFLYQSVLFFLWCVFNLCFYANGHSLYACSMHE